MSTLYQRIYDLVRKVPPGKVITYGQVGKLANCTGRVVGFAMAARTRGPATARSIPATMRARVRERRAVVKGVSRSL